MQLVLGEPPGGLRHPVLLAGFGGWGDAGSAASIALRHLLGDPAPPASAMLDPSACYDFTVARPLSTRSPDGRRWSLEYPKVAFYPVPLPAADRDLIILIGPEPHFRWPELAPAIINYARAAGVQSMLTLGAYVGPVTHHVAPVVRRTLDPALGKRLRDLELQAGNPVAALALLEATNKVTQLSFEIERLREVADTFLHDVEAALEEHPELAEQLKEMLEEEQEDPDIDGEAFESPSRAHWRAPDPD